MRKKGVAFMKQVEKDQRSSNEFSMRLEITASLPFSPALLLLARQHCSRSLCNDFLSLNKITTLFTRFFVCTLRLSSLHHLCLRYAFVLFHLILHFSDSMRFFPASCLGSRTNQLWKTKHCVLLCANIFKR